MADDGSEDTTEAEDQRWLDTFRGKSIPEDAYIEGMICIIPFVTADGKSMWRHYITTSMSFSGVLGHVELFKYALLRENEENGRQARDED